MCEFKERVIDILTKKVEGVFLILLFFLLFPATLIPQETNHKKISQKNIQQLIEELGDSDFITNYQAGKKILKIGKEAIPYLIQALNNPKSRIRFSSIILLEQLNAKEAIPEFINILKDKKRKKRERVACAFALGKLQAKEASEVLIEGLNENSNSIKTACIMSLGMLKEEKAVPYLLKFIEEKKEQIGQVALRALKEIGDRGIPQLQEIIEKGKMKDKFLALKVLGEIKSEKSIEVLKKILKSENKYLAVSSAYILSTIGKNDGKQVAIKLIKDKDPKIRTLAMKTLQNIKKIENGGKE